MKTDQAAPLEGALADRRRALRAVEDELLDVHGTPAYVFSEAALRENYRTLREALDAHYPDSTIHFAVKANYNPGILSVLCDAGCSAEAYARCELTAALEAGFDPADVLLTGMNRRPADLDRALRAGVEEFLVDNATELERLVGAAERVSPSTPPRVLVRGNPAMDVPTHPDIATATLESKFGLDVDSGRALAVARDAVAADALDLAGVQLHIGSQIRGIEPYAVAAESMLSFAADVRDELGVVVDVLDLGGGFPVPYDEPVPDSARIIERLAEAVREAADAHDLARPTLSLEPGRRLVGNAGTLLASVGVVKSTPHADFAILDAGTNAVSPSWPYPVYALSDAEPVGTYHVAGPLCYTGDVVSEDVPLPPIEPGDVLAVDRVGAYSLGSASHTNAEPKPPVLLLRESGELDVVRRGETCADVLGNTEVPDDLR